MRTQHVRENAVIRLNSLYRRVKSMDINRFRHFTSFQNRRRRMENSFIQDWSLFLVLVAVII